MTDEIDKARKEIEVTVAYQERFNDGPFYFGNSYENGTLSRVLESLQDIAASIPKKYRETARCAIGSESGYEGDHYPSIEVNYLRPETDEEVIERRKEETERALKKETEELDILKRLKAKYGDKPQERER